MDTHTLNLARKWRSKNFDQIIGQDLSVKMLKNSLFLNQYFPVYLFAGQKGCGKTSTARVFAAAVNCENLSLFQKEPKTTLLPCLDCTSCHALSKGRHPDFIEIDAASNTGVDNVRQIIDSSALLPLMGRKKIYLIDEAHMLSKAAFNAFLKLMEEPPSSVIFILATTDTQKIIETVRSRCFQLFFKPIDEAALLSHLETICQAESISYESPALSVIVKVTQGSARDALNLLEQVRFSDAQISTGAVYQVLGHLDETRLLQLLEIILHKAPHDFLQFSLKHKLDTFSAEFLWQQIVELLRACIWIKNGVSPRNYADYSSQLQFLARAKTLSYMNRLLELFYTNEQLFRSTTAQYAFLEVLLLRVCQKNEGNSNSNIPAMAAPAGTASQSDELEAVESDQEVEDTSDEQPVYDDENQALWAQLVAQIELLHDPLLTSIFKQGTLVAHDTAAHVLRADFPKELIFFSDVVESSKVQWQPLFAHVVGHTVDLQPSFTLQKNPLVVTKIEIKKLELPSTPVAKPKVMQPYTQKTYSNTRPVYQRPAHAGEPKIDVSDAQQWPQAHLLLQYFPGIVTQMKETSL